MFWIDLVFVIAIAALLSVVFVLFLGWRRPGEAEGALLSFFVILFVLTWAGGLWITPFGPRPWGAPLLVYLAVGLTIALLLAAVVPPPPRRRGGRIVTEPENDPRVAEARPFNWFFWVLLLVTTLAVILAYA